MESLSTKLKKNKTNYNNSYYLYIKKQGRTKKGCLQNLQTVFDIWSKRITLGRDYSSMTGS